MSLYEAINQTRKNWLRTNETTTPMQSEGRWFTYTRAMIERAEKIARTHNPGSEMRSPMITAWRVFWEQFQPDESWDLATRTCLGERHVSCPPGSTWNCLLGLLLRVVANDVLYDLFRKRCVLYERRHKRELNNTETMVALFPTPEGFWDTKSEPPGELKYVSIEADMFDRTFRWPRDSVEPPRLSDTFRDSDERHHGQIRTTDELVSSVGRLRNSCSPLIKQEPVDRPLELA